MQNNPFSNFFAQLQGAAGNLPASSGQDGSGQPAANVMGNANLIGAMQNAMARGSTAMPGNVIGSMGGPMPNSSAAPDMSVFRQFQLQQGQPLQATSGANSQRAAGGSGSAALLTGSPSAGGNVWSNPANPGATLNTLQVPSAAWSNPGMPSGAGAPSNPAGGMNSNPLMNAMLQTYLSQQMAMQQQQAQANPMAGLVQQMMQSMMPFNAAMPAAGAPQVPALDPNMAKQLVVQLMGQLQQSGQLSNTDSIQQLLQPAASGSNESASGVAAPVKEPAPAVPIDIDDDDTEIKEEGEVQPVVVAKKKPGPRSAKVKAQETIAIIAPAEVVVPAKTPAKKARQPRKSTPAAPAEIARPSVGDYGDAGGGDDSFGLAAGVKTEEGEILTPAPSGRRRGAAAGKSAKKNIPEVVAIDSDSEDNGSSFHAVETASEGSSIVEEKNTKKGKGRGKAQPKAPKKSGKKEQYVEPTVVGPKAKKGDLRTIPEPVRRIKIEDTAGDPEWITEQSTGSPRVAKRVPVGFPTSDEFPIHVKSEDVADVKPYIIPPGVKLRRCEVQLQRLMLKRDARGNFIIPQLSPRAMCKTEPYAAGKSLTPSGSRRGSPGAARDVSMTQMHGIELLPNLNAATQPQMRTLYVGHMKGNMQWLNLIGWAKSRCFCQCAFCPILSETPKAILSHIRSEHPDLTFALTKMKQPTGKFLYIFCRHCDFIALDVTINWLHFEVYHNVSDILEGTARPRIDDFAPAKLEIRRGLEDIMESQQSYMCYDCELVTDESKQLAIHVLQQHADTVHYNGCFVKLLGIRRPLKTENVPYKRIVADEEFAEFRQEAFICMMCDYIAHCPYMALSHNLNTHQTKRILFSCMEKDCNFNCVSETQMIQHLSGRHKLKADLTCSSTLLEPSRGSFVECAIGLNRKTSHEPSLQRCNVRPAVAENPGRISPVTFTTDEDTETEEGTANGDDAKEKKVKKKKIKTEGGEKNSLQCTAISSSLQKVSVNGNSEADEEDKEEEDKLPDDIQITVNPPSPDEVDDEDEAKSPGSAGSNDTIVEDAPVDDQVQDEEPMAVEDASASKTGTEESEEMESEQPPTLEPVAAKVLAAAEEDQSKDTEPGDFVADIPPEPYCLSTDVRLQVPGADIGAFGADVNVEGTSRDGDEQSRQLDTPEKVIP